MLFYMIVLEIFKQLFSGRSFSFLDIYPMGVYNVCKPKVTSKTISTACELRTVLVLHTGRQNGE